MNVYNKSLLFSSLLALSLLNAPLCVAMDIPDPDAADEETLRAGYKGLFQKLVAAEQELTKNGDILDRRAQEAKNLQTAASRAQEEQNRLATELQKEQDARAEVLKEKNNATNTAEQLKAELEKQHQRPIYNISSQYGTCPENTGAAQSRLFEAQANSIRNNNAYTVLTDFGGPIVTGIVIPIVKDELQPFVTEIRQNRIGKTALEQHIDTINKLKEDNAEQMVIAEQLTLLLGTMKTYCSETNDIEGCREFKAIASAIQRTQMEKIYKKALGKDYVPAEQPTNPTK